jgi:hypothetical protein
MILILTLCSILLPGRVDDERQYSGKVALVDTPAKRLAIDARSRDGAKAGDRLQVTREGKKVGVLVIAEVNKWGSWAKPEGDTPIDAFQKGDLYERIP